MDAEDLIAGYSEYTQADELVDGEEAPAASPITLTPPVVLTWQWNC